MNNAMKAPKMSAQHAHLARQQAPAIVKVHDLAISALRHEQTARPERWCGRYAHRAGLRETCGVQQFAFFSNVNDASTKNSAATMPPFTSAKSSRNDHDA